MGRSFQTRAPGESVRTTRSYRPSKRGVRTGNRHNPRSCPQNGRARVVIPTQRFWAALGTSDQRDLSRTERHGDVPRPFPAADGMHAGRVSRRARGRDAGRCGSELRWEIVPRDKGTSWKPSCRIDSTGNNSASDRLSSFPQRRQEHGASSQRCSGVPRPGTGWEEAQTVRSLLPFLFQDVTCICWSLKWDVTGQVLQLSSEGRVSALRWPWQQQQGEADGISQAWEPHGPSPPRLGEPRETMLLPMSCSRC